MSARKRQLKLGAITTGAGAPGQSYLWLDEDLPVDASVGINWYIEQARLAEEAKFDLIFIVDGLFITADSAPHYLNRLKPLTLLSALAVSTSHLDLVATTSYNDPFNTARRFASLELRGLEFVQVPGTTVFVGDTDEQAREIEHEIHTRDTDFDQPLAGLGRPFAWHDFSG